MTTENLTTGIPTTHDITTGPDVPTDRDAEDRGVLLGVTRVAERDSEADGMSGEASAEEVWEGVETHRILFVDAPARDPADELEADSSAPP